MLLLAVGRQSLPIADGHRALQGYPLYGYFHLWKFSSEPSPELFEFPRLDH